MNLSSWLNLDENILLVAYKEKQIDELMNYSVQLQHSIGIVSFERYPLISKLNVAENIVLCNMFNENISMRQALETVSPYIKSLSLDDKMQAYNKDLNSEDYFNICILRCIASKKRIILFDSPEPYDIDVLLSWLKQMGLEIRIWICCLVDRAPVYDRMALKSIDIFD